MVLFSLSTNKKLAGKVAKKLGVHLGALSINHFKDGETLVRIEEDIANKDVYVIQSITQPVNDSLMELLIFINACKNASAKSINVISPYIGYARQDRVAKAGEPITSQLVANMISSSGASSFHTFDIHTDASIKFYSIPSVNHLTSELFANYYLDLLKQYHIDTKDVVVVSPDHGSYNRAKELSKYLPGSSFAIISKYRPRPNEAKSLRIDGDADNKHAIIIDDIIDTAGTIKGAIKLLKEKNAKSIFVGATHGVFSNGAEELKQLCNDLVVTDSIEQNNEVLNTISLENEIVKIINK